MRTYSSYLSPRGRRYWLGSAIFFCLLPLSFVFELGHLTWFTLRDQPVLAGAAWVMSAVCAIVFVRSASDS